MTKVKNFKPAHFIFITVVLDMMGIGLIVPVLPDVVRRYTSDPAEVNRYFGYFVATYAAMQFFASPILGALSDKYGRRPILLSSLFGAALDYMFMAFAPSLPLLFVGRVISGLTGASMTVANSYMADVSDDSNRAANFGLIGAGFGIGFILGPIIGGLLGHVDASAPFIGAAAMNFINLGFGIFVLPESLKPENRRNIELSKLNPISSFAKLLKQSEIMIFIVTYALMMLAGQVHPSVWTLYTEHKFHWTSWQVGLSLSVVGIVFGISQGILTKKLVPKWGEQNALKVGLFFSVFGFMLYATASQGWMMYLIIVGTCLSSLSGPCLQSLMTRQVDPDRQGELQGGLVSLTSVTSIIAPLLYSSAFNWATGQKFAINIVGLPYFLAAVIVFLSWILLLKTLQRKN